MHGDKDELRRAQATHFLNKVGWSFAETEGKYYLPRSEIYPRTFGEGWDGYSWLTRLPLLGPVTRKASKKKQSSPLDAVRQIKAGWLATSRLHPGSRLMDVDFFPNGTKASQEPIFQWRNLTLGDTSVLVASGAYRWAGLQTNQTGSQQTDMPCDEARAFREKCAPRLRSLESHLGATEYHRGLVLEITKSFVRSGDSIWGVGNLLPLAYLVHAWCVQFNRFCYIKTFDLDLGRLFGYHGNRSWDPDEADLSRYGDPVKIRKALYLRDVYSTIATHPNASLIHIQTHLLGDWFTSDFYQQALDRCLNHFVSQPRFPIPKLTHNPLHAFHFRTWFADVPAVDVSRVAPKGRETRRWFQSTGCSAVFLKWLGSRGLVLADSVGWARWLAAEFGLQYVEHPTDRPSRSWNTTMEMKLAAVMDIYVAGLARTVHAGDSSRFLGPALGRSVCVQSIKPLRETCPFVEFTFVRVRCYDTNPEVYATVTRNVQVSACGASIPHPHSKCWHLAGHVHDALRIRRRAAGPPRDGRVQTCTGKEVSISASGIPYQSSLQEPPLQQL